MFIRTPRIGAVCAADPIDIHTLARDFAYELRQFIKTDRDAERRQASLRAIAEFEKAGDDPQALQAFVKGSGLAGIQAYCLPFMTFSRSAAGDYGFWPDLEALDQAVRSGDGVIKLDAGDAWPPPWTPSGRDIRFVMAVNDHGNLTLYDRRRQEIWSCV